MYILYIHIYIYIYIFIYLFIHIYESQAPERSNSQLCRQFGEAVSCASAGMLRGVGRESGVSESRHCLSRTVRLASRPHDDNRCSGRLF